MKTQVIALDKLEKFLISIRRHRLINIVAHKYEKDSHGHLELKSVLVIYKEL